MSVNIISVYVGRPSGPAGPRPAAPGPAPRPPGAGGVPRAGGGGGGASDGGGTRPRAPKIAALSPGFTAFRLSITTIIGLAFPAAIRLSRIRSTWPWRYQPVSSSPHPCSRYNTG